MKFKQFLLILLLITLSFSSCKIIFTQGLREQVESQKIDVKHIQFYTSRTIILQRVVSSSIVVEDTAKLKQTKQIELERIKICRNTPGVCIETFDNELEVIFELKDSSSLKFVLSDTSSNKLARYKIGAIRWEDKVGVIPYYNETYYLQPRNNFFQPRCNEAALKVKRCFMYKLKIKMRRLKGVRVDEK